MLDRTPTCSGPITSSAGTDYIGGFGTILTENIGALGATLGENETKLSDKSPITSAADHITWGHERIRIIIAR
jgi:hypothetical protein